MRAVSSSLTEVRLYETLNDLNWPAGSVPDYFKIYIVEKLKTDSWEE